jgi:hypothetical protein
MERNETGGPFSAALTRFEFRQRHPFTAIFEDDLYGHVDVDFFDGAAGDVAAESRPVVEIDPGCDVRNVGAEAAQCLANDFANHGEGKNFALATDLYPFEFVAGAVAANRPRAKNPRPAVLAFLHHELAGFGAVPKRLVDGRNFRERFANFFFGHVTGTFREYYRREFSLTST